MKIVVLDGYTENPGDISWAPLEALGDVTVYDRTSYEESPLIAERIGDAEVIVINKTPVSRATIDACPGLKAIAVLATGYNVVDYEYAKEKGIPVMNVPVYGTDNVSQFAVSLMLEACSHIGHHSDSVHAGEWASSVDWCYWHYPMIEVSGKTAGIIGLGKIACAAVDVVSTEPIKPDNVLLTAKNCIITPHISWATREARERIMQTTADNIRAFMEGEPVNVVNRG